MPGLKANTAYQDASTTMAGVLNKISSLTKNAPRRTANSKSINPYASYAPLSSSVQQTTANQNVGNLGTITTPYGGKTRYEGYHPGVDVANKVGTPVPSYSNGVVVDMVTGKVQGNPGYGNYVIIKDENGNLLRYSHLSNSFVKLGQKVSKGTVLGPMGNSGSTYSESGGSGSHLDLRIRDLYGKYINPLKFING